MSKKEMQGMAPNEGRRVMKDEAEKNRWHATGRVLSGDQCPKTNEGRIGPQSGKSGTNRKAKPGRVVSDPQVPHMTGGHGDHQETQGGRSATW